MRRFLLLGFSLLLAASSARAQAPAPHDHEAPGFAPPVAFQAARAAAGPYACTAAQAGPGGRCASTAIPGDLTAAQTPQFLLITFDDCITTESEALVRGMLSSSVRNPDERPVPATYFLSLEGCPGHGGASDEVLVRQRYLAGDEIAIHTRSHTTSAATTVSGWINEIRDVQAYLKRIGLGADAGRGFRAPYVETNAALYQALDSLDLLYDSSVFEVPFWAPVSNGTAQYVWPFTYDVWNPLNPAQYCALWTPTNNCPSRPHRGLWQVPLYYYVGGTQASPTYYGVFDIGEPSYSGHPQRIAGRALQTVLRDHRNTRLSGNRAPLTLYLHANALADKERRSTLRKFLRETLATGDVWAVTMQGLIEWMKAPVPNAGMEAWYDAYCRRHACGLADGNASHGDDSVLDADDVHTDTPRPAVPTTSGLQAFPSPTRGPLTVQATTLHAAATLAVYDVLGREVHRTTLGAPGAFTHALDLGTHPAGLYLLRLNDGPHTTLRPVLLQR